MAAPAKIDTLQDLVHALDEHPEWVDELRARLLTRELLELPQKLADFIAATEKRFVAVEARLDRIEDGQTRIRNDLGLLKGGHARNVAERQAGLIVEDLGLEYVRALAFDDIRSMVRAHDTSDLPANDLRSFPARGSNPGGDRSAWCILLRGREDLLHGQREGHPAGVA